MGVAAVIDDDDDDIIGQVRAAREAIFASYGYDFHALGAALRAMDAAGTERVVSFPSRLPVADPPPPAGGRPTPSNSAEPPPAPSLPS